MALANGLAEIEESPWGPQHGRPFDARALARKLERYRIKPKKIRVGDATARGYQREQFEDDWKRLVRVPPPFERNNRNNPYATGVSADFATGTKEECSGHEIAQTRME